MSSPGISRIIDAGNKDNLGLPKPKESQQPVSDKGMGFHMHKDSGKRCGLGNQDVWFKYQQPPCPNHMNLCKSLNFPVPWFSHPWNGDINNNYLTESLVDLFKDSNTVKSLKQHLAYNRCLIRCFLAGASGKNLLANAGDTRDESLILGSGKLPCNRKWQPNAVFLPGKSHGQRSLEGYSP